jgi:hypothetical protein
MKIAKIIVLFIATLLCINSFGQVSNYTFSETTGTYTAITGGTQLVTTTGGVTSYDTDGSYFTLAAGNQFTFNSTTITSVIMQGDGSLWLNPGTSTTGNSVTVPISSTATAAGIVSALGMDLRSTAISSQVYERRWQDDGTEVIFQWQNAARYIQSSAERFSFQIRINKSTGVVRIVYGNMTTIQNSTTYQPQVGLRGSTNTDYNIRRLTTSVPDVTPNWGAPNGTGGYTTGSNGYTCRFTTGSPSCIPTSGLIFIYSPPACSSPSSPLSSNVSTSTSDISWTASPSSPSNGYQWEVRTSGAGGSGASGLTTSGTTSVGVVSASVTGLTSNTTYTLYVRSDCGSSNYSSWVSSSTFTTTIQAPSNDNSVGAISLTINSNTTCTTTTTGTSIGSTQTLSAQSGYGTADDDVWYKFTATASSLDMSVSRGTMGDLVVEAFTSSLVSIGVVDGSTTTENVSFTNLTIGNVYYVRVYSFGSTVAKQGTFTICMTTPTQPPINDNASGAITLIVNDPYVTGTNDGATSSTSSPTPTGPSYYGGDVWYKVIVPSGGTVQIRTASLVLTDMVMEVYSGVSSSSLTSITYNDDSLSFSNYMPYIPLSSRPQGETIWIRVWDYSNDEVGTFKIRVTTPISLPIELLSFNGVSKSGYNSLYWSTSSEIDNDYFSIEKTIDGNTFNVVGVINGSGNSQVLNNYELKDFSVEKVINYYRLKQTDINGNYKYSDVISIDNTQESLPTLIKVVNMVGQEVDEYTNGVYLFYYDDGSIVKQYFKN